MDIDTMVENHFKKNRDIFGFESIAQLIEEVMDTMEVLGIDPALLREAPQPNGRRMLLEAPQSESFDWNAIPEIPISELGWSDTRTKDTGGPQGGQRKLLMDYLKQIGPEADIPVKIKELNEFMANPDIEGGDAREKISKILSYLVFYKTLTRVITNFNASSAGFSFESFLAVLTGGEQIKAGGETIADYKHGDEYVSLKLYSESSVEVGGSWQDLVDDLANDSHDNRMTYLVVLKSLDGEGLDQEGTLSFYRFTLTLDNIANFIDKSSKDSREMIALPLTPEGQFIDLSAKEPEAAEPEAAELEEAAQRVRAGGEAYQKNFNEVMNSEATNFISSIIEKFPELAPLKDELLSIVQDVQLGSRNFPKLTEKALDGAVKYINAKISEIASDPEKAKILNAQVPPPTGTGSRWRVHKYLKVGLKQAITDTNQKLKKDPEATRKTGAESLLKNIRVDRKSIVRSITYYNSLVGKPELQKKALFSSYGYLGAKKFLVGKKVATKDGIVKGMPVEQLGVLEIGAARIVPILEQARGELNDQVYAIFSNLKTLSTSLNAYFASGLTDPEAGQLATDASKEVSTRTEKVVGDDEGGGGGDPRTKGVATSMGGPAAPQAIREKKN
jgi:hypothetical protein